MVAACWGADSNCGTDPVTDGGSTFEIFSLESNQKTMMPAQAIRMTNQMRQPRVIPWRPPSFRLARDSNLRMRFS